MKRRLTVLLASAAIAVVALTACSQDGGSTSPDKASLKWWGWNAAESQQTIDAFEKENPGITVTFTQYSNADYLNTLRASLVSGKGPDVLQLSPGSLVANYGPLVEDLAPLANKEWGADWKSKYNSLGTSQLASGTKQVALPSYMSAAGFVYYNQDILTKTGAKVPTDLAEWASECKKIEAAGYGCLAQGAKDNWASLDIYLSLINSIDHKIVYKAIDGKASWTSAPFVKAMAAWKSLFTDGIAESGATAVAEYPDAFNSFVEGKSAFVALGTWNTAGTMTKAGVQVSQKAVTEPITGTFLAAPFPGAAAGIAPTGAFGGPDNGWAISQTSKQKDAAWKFVAFLEGKTAQTIQASVANIPALKGIPVSTSDVIKPEQAGNIIQQQKSVENLIGYRQIPYADLETALGQALSAVAAGTSSPEDALKAVQTASDAVKR